MLNTHPNRNHYGVPTTRRKSIIHRNTWKFTICITLPQPLVRLIQIRCFAKMCMCVSIWRRVEDHPLPPLLRDEKGLMPTSKYDCIPTYPTLPPLPSPKPNTAYCLCPNTTAHPLVPPLWHQLSRRSATRTNAGAAAAVDQQ